MQNFISIIVFQNNYVLDNFTIVCFIWTKALYEEKLIAHMYLDQLRIYLD